MRRNSCTSWAISSGIPHVWLRKGLVDPRIVHLLPKEKALHFQVIPMFRVSNVLTLATTDPNAVFVFDEVSKITRSQCSARALPRRRYRGGHQRLLPR